MIWKTSSSTQCRHVFLGRNKFMSVITFRHEYLCYLLQGGYLITFVFGSTQTANAIMDLSELT